MAGRQLPSASWGTLPAGTASGTIDTAMGRGAAGYAIFAVVLAVASASSAAPATHVARACQASHAKAASAFSPVRRTEARPTRDAVVPSAGTLARWTSFSADLDTPADTSVRFQLSVGGGSTWLYHDGSAWTDAGGDITNATDATAVNANIDSLPATADGLLARAVLSTTDPRATPVLRSVNVGYEYVP